MADAVADLLVKMDVDAARFRTEIEKSVRAPLQSVDGVASKASRSTRDFGQAANESAEGFKALASGAGSATGVLGTLSQRIRDLKSEQSQHTRTVSVFTRELQDLIPESAGTAAKGLAALAASASIVGFAFEATKFVIEQIAESYKKTAERTEAVTLASEKFGNVSKDILEALAVQAEATADRTHRKFGEVFEEVAKGYSDIAKESKKAFDDLDKSILQKGLTASLRVTQDELKKIDDELTTQGGKYDALLQKINAIPIAIQKLHPESVAKDQAAAIAQLQIIADLEARRAAVGARGEKSGNLEFGEAIQESQSKATSGQLKAAQEEAKKRQEEAIQAQKELRKQIQEVDQAIIGLGNHGSEAAKRIASIKEGATHDLIQKAAGASGTVDQAVAAAEEKRQLAAVDRLDAAEKNRKEEEKEETAIKKLGEALETLRKKRVETAGASELEKIDASLLNGELGKLIATIDNPILKDAFTKSLRQNGEAISQGTQRIKALRLDVEQYTKTTEKLAQVSQTAARTIADSFEQNVGKGLKAVFEDIGASFVKMIARMVLEAGSANIVGAILGIGQGNGIGFDIIKKLAGAGIGAGANAGSDAEIAASKPTYLAGGGPVFPGGSYMVGERGPELFSPSVSGNIIPHNAAGRAGSNGPQVMQVQINERALNMTLKDWLERELADQAATR